MWFRKRPTKADPLETKIQEERQKTLEATRRATDATKKVNELLEKGGTTYLIFLATGGERRYKR